MVWNLSAQCLDQWEILSTVFGGRVFSRCLVFFLERQVPRQRGSVKLLILFVRLEARSYIDFRERRAHKFVGDVELRAEIGDWPSRSPIKGVQCEPATLIVGAEKCAIGVTVTAFLAWKRLLVSEGTEYCHSKVKVYL